MAPSNSLSVISEENQQIANMRFEELGLRLTFSKYCREMDEFLSSSIEQRVADLHEAFADECIRAIFTVTGGNNINQILKYLDYRLIKRNPKILCGYSDTTALLNAIHHKTGLVTYSGPAYSTLGMLKGIDYTIEYLTKCLFRSSTYTLFPPQYWSDDRWHADQENRKFHLDEGIKIANHGQASGMLIGGNLCTLNLLQGTEFMPSLHQTVLFLEDDHLTFPENFDRDLQSLIHQMDFSGVIGIVFGKFQIKSGMTEDKLLKIIETKKELTEIPILYNVSFGHTSPQACLPIGGTVCLDTQANKKIRIKSH